VKSLNGLVMELEDCVNTRVIEVIATQDPNVAFKDCDYCILCGSYPFKPGMERRDLLPKNAAIFKEQGEAIRRVAKPNVKCTVVGNPANTNAWLLKHFSGLPAKNITALTRLDFNRSRTMIARRLRVNATAVKNLIVWGNHAGTMFADVDHATVDNDAGTAVPVRSAVGDDAWLDNQFVTDVQQRWKKVVELRGNTSATSASQAILDHVRDWHFGTQPGEWVSMGVCSDSNPYGIPPDLICSLPVTIRSGEWTIVPDLVINTSAREHLILTINDLVEERNTALQIVQPPQTS